jgi:hypothetical protein
VKINSALEKTLVKELARQYKVKVKFAPRHAYGGAFFFPRKIVISTSHERFGQSLINIFFHELGHWHASHNDIYPIYHEGYWDEPADWPAIRATALRAEQWVDKWGKRECLKHFPDFEWTDAYRTSWEKISLRDMLDRYLR